MWIDLLREIKTLKTFDQQNYYYYKGTTYCCRGSNRLPMYPETDILTKQTNMLQREVEMQSMPMHYYQGQCAKITEKYENFEQSKSLKLWNVNRNK